MEKPDDADVPTLPPTDYKRDKGAVRLAQNLNEGTFPAAKVWAVNRKPVKSGSYAEAVSKIEPVDIGEPQAAVFARSVC